MLVSYNPGALIEADDFTGLGGHFNRRIRRQVRAGERRKQRSTRRIPRVISRRRKPSLPAAARITGRAPALVAARTKIPDVARAAMLRRRRMKRPPAATAAIKTASVAAAAKDADLQIERLQEVQEKMVELSATAAALTAESTGATARPGPGAVAAGIAAVVGIGAAAFAALR